MLSILWRSKWIILVTALVAGAVVAFDSYSEEQGYRADTLLVVSSLAPTNVFSNENMLATSYAELATTDRVKTKAFAIPGNENDSDRTTTSVISAEVDSETPFIRISATNTDARQAVTDANAVADALVDYVSELEQQNLQEKRDSLLDQLVEIEGQQNQVAASQPVDQTRINALEAVRQSVIRQYEEINAGLTQSNITIVDEAERAVPLTTNPARNTIIAIMLGALAGAIIGFSVNSVRKALRWESSL